MIITKSPGSFLYLIRIILLLLIFIKPDLLNAQIQFQKTYSYHDLNDFFDVIQSRDSGYVTAGVTDVNMSNYDMLVVKTDKYGTVLWSKMYGGQFDDYANSIEQTIDGGYIVSGFSYSFSGDFYLVKIDSAGGVQWSKTFGSVQYDKSYKIHQTTDGGYILTGTLYDNNSFGSDVALIKISTNGTLQWEKIFGNPAREDRANDVKQTSDGGNIVAGYTNLNGISSKDIYIIKTDSSGTLEWTKVFYSNEDEDALTILQKDDNGYLIGGYTNSNTSPAGNADALIISTDNSGTIQWAKTYGGVNDDQVFSLDKTNDSGYVAAGITTGYGSYVRLGIGFKINTAGTVIWAHSYGKAQWVTTDFSSVKRTFDNGYIFAGQRDSSGSSLHTGYLVKTDQNGFLACLNSIIALSNNVFSSSITTLDSSWSGILGTQPATVTFTPPYIYQTTFCVNVGIEENEKSNSFAIYPNPANSVIHFNLPSPELYFCEIFNVIGEKLISKINERNIDISGLSEGIYFLKIKQGNESYVQKLLKK
jgi:hypothetical protein